MENSAAQKGARQSSTGERKSTRLIIAVIIRLVVLLGLVILLTGNTTRLDSATNHHNYLKESYEYKYESLDKLIKYPIWIEETKVLSNRQGVITTELGSFYSDTRVSGKDIQVYRDVYGALRYFKDGDNIQYGINYTEISNQPNKLSLAEYGVLRGKVEISVDLVKNLNISSSILAIFLVIVGITAIGEIVTAIKSHKTNIKVKLPMGFKLLSIATLAILAIFSMYHFIQSINGYVELSSRKEVIEQNYDTSLLGGTIYCRVDYSTATVYDKGKLVAKTNLGPIKSSYLSNNDTVVVYRDVFGDLCPIFKEKISSNIVYVDKYVELPSGYIELVDDEDRIMYLGYSLMKIENDGIMDNIQQSVQLAVVSLICFAFSVIVTMSWGEYDRQISKRNKEKEEVEREDKTDRGNNK